MNLVDFIHARARVNIKNYIPTNLKTKMQTLDMIDQILQHKDARNVVQT